MNEEMDFEKRSSKRSFLQLFDWNGKSRKKLFSNKSESHEKSKQGEEKLNGSKFSRLTQVDRNGYDPGPNMIDNYNLNCSYAKAPGVVARLMGLDSLPTSDTVEPSFTPESFRDTRYRYSTAFPGFQIEGNMAMYDGMRNKLDGFSKNPVEVMLHKVQNRPIEKFQTEVLPPKSAKPISITHHRLLSPIKSPGFIRTMESDYLMEAASKIIEQSPRSMMTHKLPSVGSPSVPLRIQDIKEKVEAAEKSRRNFRTSQKGKEERFIQHESREEGLDLLRASGKPKAAKYEDSRKKSGSFSFQAKQKIPKRDELGSVNIPSSVNQGQASEVKRRFVGRSVERKHKNVETKSRIIKQSDVFRQTSHRQNSETKEGSDSFRHPIPNDKEKKPSSSSGFSRPSKSVNRIVVSTDSLSTMKESQASDYRKGHAHDSSIARKCSRKKRVYDEGNVATLIIDERSDNCNYETHKSNLWESAVGKSGMDVVSFTFNSPIKKPISESTSSGKSPESKRSPFDYQSDSTQGLDVASGDALSILLEQKLKELAFRVETSQKDLIYSELLCGCADSSLGSASDVDMTSSKSAKRLDLSCSSFRFECSSSSPLDESWNDSMPRWQGSNEACNGTVPSNSDGSCKSRDPNGYISNKGIKRSLSVEALDITGWSSSRNSNGVDNELLDSASSTSLGTFTCSAIRESSNWELDYIKYILSNASLMLEEFVLEKTQTLVPSGLFDIMEDGNLWWNQNVGDDLKLSRKALFDCVGESLQLKCMPFINKSRKHLMKLTMLFGQPDHLSKELYKEISGWKNMEDLLVDELVDKDMSTQLGRWVDFEIEVFEQGAEIDKEILASLFDELVYDFFL